MNKLLNLPDPPDWFDLELSLILNLPDRTKNNCISSFENLPQGIQCSKFEFKDRINNIEFTKFNKNPLDEHKKINDSTEKRIKKIKDNTKISDSKKDIKIKEINTRTAKKINHINKVIKCDRYYLRMSTFQKNKIFDWMKECQRVYNKCVEIYTKNEHYFDVSYKSFKASFFDNLYGKRKKPAPYDMLTDELRAFCSNLKSCKTNLAEGNVSHFTIREKHQTETQSILIPSHNLGKHGFFTSFLGNIHKFEHIYNKYNKVFECDCRLQYIYETHQFILLVPNYTDIKKIKEREKIVALDPGAKIFQAYYGLNDFGTIGYDMAQYLSKKLRSIRHIQRHLSKGTNKKNEKLKNRRRLKKKLQNIYKNIRNKVNELHNQVAIFLCRTYDTILIPIFQTKKMIKNKDFAKKHIKEKVNKIFKNKPREEAKKELRKYETSRRLSGRYKFILNMLSHYRFRQHLLNKCEEYGCRIKVVTEEYTSKTCTNCGHQSDIYVKRLKYCPICRHALNRDVNGSRNILIKNILPLIEQEAEKPEWVIAEEH